MSFLQNGYELRSRALIVLGVLGFLGASLGSTDGGKLAASAQPTHHVAHGDVLGRSGVAMSAFEVLGVQQAATIDIAAGLKKLADDANAGRNPTVKTPTEIEGNWVGTCRNVYTSFNGKAVRSSTVGYVFRGNSFVRQVDYYPEPDCRNNAAGTAGETRVAAEVASGWFALRDGPGDLKSIDLLAAPNFGKVFMINVYQVKGSSSGAVLLMGATELNNKQRPTTATQEYRPWDVGKNGK
jgi:hypothetical protein